MLPMSFSNRDLHESDLTTSGDIITTNKIDYHILNRTENNILLFVVTPNNKASYMCPTTQLYSELFCLHCNVNTITTVHVRCY